MREFGTVPGAKGLPEAVSNNPDCAVSNQRFTGWLGNYDYTEVIHVTRDIICVI